MQQIIDSLGVALNNIAAFIPNLLGAILVLLLGWAVAAILRVVARRGLETIGFNRLVERGRVHDVIQRTGTAYEPARVVASLVFWTVMITTFLLVANILGLVAVSTLLTRLVAFLPNVFVAIVVLVVAVAVGELIKEAIMASIGDIVEGGSTIATAAKWGLIVFGAFMALNQLQISPTIVNSLFIITLGAVGIAFAISFGLGNVELAREITRKRYEQTQRTAQQVQAQTEQRKPQQQRPEQRRPTVKI